MKHTQCPACQSLNTSKATGQFASSGSQAFPNRICLDCGTAWRPPCPRWLAIIIIVAGCAAPIAWIAIQSAVVQGMSDVDSLIGATEQRQTGKSGQNPLVNGFVIAVGLSAVVYGARVLLKKSGQMAILGKVEGSKK